MIRAVIFDMDGLLIDSEPIWQDVEIGVFNKLGVPVDYQSITETTGRRCDEVVKHWFDKHPWGSPSVKVVEEQIFDGVTQAIIKNGRALPGAVEAVRTCKKSGYIVAIASSSPMSLIEACMKKLGITELIDVSHSGYNEEHGKPDPAIFLTTAQSLNVNPDECVVFEDSISGVMAAKRAGMRCIAVPPEGANSGGPYADADIILNSLLDFNLSLIKD